MKLAGKILGAELAAPIAGARVTFKNQEQSSVHQAISREDGYWCLETDEYEGLLHFSAQGFVDKHIPVKDCPNVVRLLEDNLIGYQDKLWFNPGEKVNAYIHSSNSYEAKLFRHGLKKECVLDCGKQCSFIQSIPNGFFVDNGVEWEPTLKYTIPYNARPGLYSLLLSSKEDEEFAIPMIVSTPSKSHNSRSKLLVLASTNNWLSYNIWGGRSRYRNFENQSSDDFIGIDKPALKSRLKSLIASILPVTVKEFIKHTLLKKSLEAKAWQFHRLSIKRPFTNCALEQNTVFAPFTNHLAAGEWRVLAWLEREGFEYDIISGYELHNNPDLVSKYKALIFSTHCEYWSRKMYEGVLKYHNNNGLWIINISGNTMYREVDFYKDGSHRCTSLRFSRSVADEAQLLGVRFSMSDYSTCAKYKITAPLHWAFKGIPVNPKFPYFGGMSLNQNTTKKTKRYDPGRPGLLNGLQGLGASGWETDKIANNAPSDMKLIAKGCNKSGGANMVVREPRGSRGGMFTASSLVFGGALLIDEVASMLVNNILERALNEE